MLCNHASDYIDSGYPLIERNPSEPFKVVFRTTNREIIELVL